VRPEPGLEEGTPTKRARAEEILNVGNLQEAAAWPASPPAANHPTLQVGIRQGFPDIISEASMEARMEARMEDSLGACSSSSSGWVNIAEMAM